MTWELNPSVICLVVLIVWMAIVLGGELLQSGGTTSLQELVSEQLIYSLMAAPFFLLAVVAYTGWWQQVGLQFEGSTNNLKVLVLPGLAVIVIWAVAFYRGLAWGKNLMFVGANTLLIGFSEELMFRGIVFYGIESSFGSRWAVVISAVIFGLIHAMNALITGNLKQAVEQAFLAILFGFWIVALRASLNGIVPLIVVHWLWDFGLGAASVKVASVNAASVSSVLPIACEIVLFAYGLWLLYA
jgi:uncharacterized protein